VTALENRLQRTREMLEDRWVFRFDNGLVVHTDPFMKKDRARVLPLGGPQDVILNRLVCLPEIVRGKRIFDPFAGSGILGLMALKLGAAHVDFLDISPRARTFQIENAERNGLSPERYRALLGSIAEFEPASAYDLVLANPPFVPTPAGIDGTLTSNGGAEGNALVDSLLARLDRTLRPEGEAFVYVMQLVENGRPLIVDSVLRCLSERTTELTPVQTEIMPFEYYASAYRQCFPARESEIERWAATLTARHGATLGVQHYAMHVQPKRPGPPSWTIVDNLDQKYGRGFAYPAQSMRELALARAMENVILD
jgi:release factor glutamine methyltransferase